MEDYGALQAPTKKLRRTNHGRLEHHGSNMHLAADPKKTPIADPQNQKSSRSGTTQQREHGQNTRDKGNQPGQPGDEEGKEKKSKLCGG